MCVIQKAEATDLIQSYYGQRDLAPTFVAKREEGKTYPINTFDLSKLDKNAVLFHRCKDGSLIDALRERRKDMLAEMNRKNDELNRERDAREALRDERALKATAPNSIPAPTPKMTAADYSQNPDIQAMPEPQSDVNLKLQAIPDQTKPSKLVGKKANPPVPVAKPAETVPV
jgi:hypothetical protein